MCQRGYTNCCYCLQVGRLRGLIAAPPNMAAKLLKNSTNQVEGMLRSAATKVGGSSVTCKIFSAMLSGSISF